jgi:RNA polymerase sigma-70 factor, ECF subfamily
MNPITSLAGAAAMPFAAPALGARGGSRAATAAAKTSSGVPATGGLAHSSLGPILADSTVRTLYPAPAAADTSSVARASEGRCPSARPRPWTGPCRSGMQRLDPEVLGAHLGRLLRTASALCDSRESAEDLVQETLARILARPRWLRGGDELAYLTQALRNTFVTSTRTAARRPHAVSPLEGFDPADVRTDARPEEAVITGQVFPAIARLPESFRLALVAVDIAGLSYGEAARALGAPEATITTRLYRARQRVAHELDPERSGATRSKGTRRVCARSVDGTEHAGGIRRVA